MIILNEISKVYANSQKRAVNTVSATIEKGEFFVLVGPSGCGKSTLLRMLAGLEDITDGTMYIKGECANSLPPKDRHLSMVFQNYALYPHLTVGENIVFGLKVRKVKKDEREKRLKEAAEMVGLIEYLKVKPGQLSGGQRQRVALARAIVSQTPICLMDEPLSNLDAKLRGQMRIEIREIQRRLGITMIYVTHDQIEAMTMGDRIMVLNNGEVQQIGTPLCIYNEPENEFVASFIGSPSMNIGKGTFIDNGVEIGDLHIPFYSNKRGGVKVGIRPEHIQLDENGQEVTIHSVEVLGYESIINFYMGESVWKAKVSSQVMLGKGDKIKIGFPLNKLYYFDAETSERILIQEMKEMVGV
ncbi:ABC transporter ATP-binding protein [Priestia filamentosa]|uniref:ABC transporter ATP-binding protein n=1 Tax=Priestia filamentosa TaxID=1402861 RepID=UPI00397DDE66